MLFNSMEFTHLIIRRMPKDLMGLLSKIEPTPGC